MTQKKLLHPRSQPECNVFPVLPYVYVLDSEIQTESIPYNHEENNHRVMNELKVLSQHLLDYNRKTFRKMIQDIDNDYRERVSANKKLRYKIKDLKMQVQDVEKELAFIKSDSIHQLRHFFPCASAQPLFPSAGLVEYQTLGGLQGDHLLAQ